jgi:dihydrofolate reductase
MRKLSAFIQVTLDGYFAGEDGDIGWAHRDSDDAEWNAFVAGNAKAGGVLVFGRITYEMMASYWPTPLAEQNDPVVAERMNHLEKIVFSRTLDQASWNNTTLVDDDAATWLRRMKQTPGEDMAILGSGSLVSQLAQEGLIDEFQVVVNPVVLGRGRTPFEGLDEDLDLALVSSRTFGNGNVLLCYEPMT